MRRLTGPLAFLTAFSVVLASGAALAYFSPMGAGGRDETTVEAPVVEAKAGTAASPTTTKPAPPKAEAKPAKEQPAKVQPAKEQPEQPKPAETSQPADTEPPAFAILFPADGQTFTEKKVVFEGTVEPGARVYAGSYEAEVDGSGAWRILLVLSPGAQTATLKAVDAAGNVSKASVKVILEVEKTETTEAKAEKPKEQPKEEQVGWTFIAVQAYGSCAENPPYDVFSGTGKPGDTILVASEFGSATTTVGAGGHWEVRVEFPDAPVGKAFRVKVKDGYGNVAKFEFVRTG
jgi:hypothetical protein